MIPKRRCDCENNTCHPKADCQNEATVKTHWSRICVDCAAKMPLKYLDYKSRAAGEREE
jgi:hypothetical protein